MKAYAQRNQRKLVHEWEHRPTELSPKLMKSVCGFGSSFPEDLITPKGTEPLCKVCEGRGAFDPPIVPAVNGGAERG